MAARFSLQYSPDLVAILFGLLLAVVEVVCQFLPLEEHHVYLNLAPLLPPPMAAAPPVAAVGQSLGWLPETARAS